VLNGDTNKNKGKTPLISILFEIKVKVVSLEENGKNLFLLIEFSLEVIANILKELLATYDA
jgi:hypothetical protein